MKRLFRWRPVSLLAAVSGLALAVLSPEVAGAAPTAESLVRTDPAALESLYRGGSVGPSPTGFFPGKAIPEADRATVRRSRAIGLLWKGKEFSNGLMVNRLAFGLRAVRAEVYEGESWFDGQPSIILDYANTSKRFSAVRDEMREVSPGVYLGMTYMRKPTGPERAMFYSLQGSGGR